MIMVWNRYAHMQPTGPTIDYLPPWWHTSVCQMNFSEYWKKVPDEQIAGPFAESAALSNTTAVNQEWQGVIDAAEATAASEAQIAIQLHDDAAEAWHLQDVFDLLSLGQPESCFGEISLTTGPFDPPSEQRALTMQFLEICMFHYFVSYGSSHKFQSLLIFAVAQCTGKTALT